MLDKMSGAIGIGNIKRRARQELLKWTHSSEAYLQGREFRELELASYPVGCAECANENSKSCTESVVVRLKADGWTRLRRIRHRRESKRSAAPERSGLSTCAGPSDRTRSSGRVATVGSAASSLRKN
jgi:hypothetical protein